MRGNRSAASRNVNRATSVNRAARQNGRNVNRAIGQRNLNARQTAAGNRPGVNRLTRQQARVSQQARAQAVRHLQAQTAVTRNDRRAAQRFIARHDRRAPAAVRNALAGKMAWRRHFAQNRFEHGRDHHRFRRGLRFASIGWIGPVFWPYAYDDIFDYAFWAPDYYEDPFWAYGYPDIYATIFSPYGYDDLVGYDDVVGSAGPSGSGAVRASTSRSRSRSARTTTAQSLANRLAQMCGSDAREVASWPVDQIQDLVKPTDQQRQLLDDLANASVQASQLIKNSCPTDISLSPLGRLDAMGKRIDAMIQAVNLVQPPLTKFYDSLTDEQKQRLNAITAQGSTARQGNAQSLTQSCGQVTPDVTTWPEEQIDKAVHLNDSQREALGRLKDATSNAADMLKSACPGEMPITPVARLEAVGKRLDAMRDAVKTVRAALAPFYDSLSDEQKAQFNEVGQTLAQQGRS